MLVAPQAHAQAPAEPSSSESSEPREPSEVESPSRFTLGIGGFGGGLFSKEERRGGGGGDLSLAFGIVPERWEVELSLAVVAARDIDPMGVFEVVGKRIFERRGAWAPHVLLGPLFSLDFGDDLKPTGGVIVGGGVCYWFNERFGAASDAAYRLLIGAGPEVEHILTLALALHIRL
jgi:hypothetical protein